jgi:hypothetical protein
MNVRRVLALVALAVVLAATARAELKAGDKLDESTWEQGKDFLPPEILEHYKDGKFASPIGEIKAGDYALDDRFHKASAANEGKFKLDERGSLVDAATDKPPEYSFGAPFPKLDPNDPQVASKVMWNYEYAYWSNGNNRVQAFLMWLDEKSKAPERAIALDSKAKVYEGNLVREPNPQQFSRLDKNFLVEPADLHGSASLTWRLADPAKRDQAWAYVPALRRVRGQPGEPPDGVFGSEMTQDDGFNGFDAKPEEFSTSSSPRRRSTTPSRPTRSTEDHVHQAPARPGLGLRYAAGALRLPRSGLEGPPVGVARQRAREAAGVDDRSRPERPLLPLR